jgi:hypothetical protein
VVTVGSARWRRELAGGENPAALAQAYLDFFADR